jgi:hypothetical protein
MGEAQRDKRRRMAREIGLTCAWCAQAGLEGATG